MPFCNLKVVEVVVIVECDVVEDNEFVVVVSIADVVVVVVPSDPDCWEVVDARITTIAVVANKAVTIDTTLNNNAEDEVFVIEQQPRVKVPKTVPIANAKEHTKGFSKL